MMFRLAWEWEPGADEVPALSRFMITKKRNGGGAGDTTTTITQNLLPAPAERSFLDPISSGALSARNYHYRYEITAIDSAGNLSPPISSGRLKKTTLEATDTVGPVIVSSISGEPVSWNTAELSWPQTTDDVEMGGYQLWSRQGNIWGVVATTTDTVTDPVFHRDPQLFSGREYWYTVWAFDAVGNRRPAQALRRGHGDQGRRARSAAPMGHGPVPPRWPGQDPCRGPYHLQRRRPTRNDQSLERARAGRPDPVSISTV